MSSGCTSIRPTTWPTVRDEKSRVVALDRKQNALPRDLG